MSGKKNILMKSEEKRSLAQVAAFLRELAGKIETNQLSLMQSGEEIQVTLTDPVTLEIELQEKHKKGLNKRQLEIEIEWYPGGESGSIELG